MTVREFYNLCKSCHAEDYTLYTVIAEDDGMCIGSCEASTEDIDINPLTEQVRTYNDPGVLV